MLRSYLEQPLKKLFYFLLAIVLCINLYDWLIKPPTTEQIVADASRSVVVIECISGDNVYMTGGFVASNYGHIITVEHGLEGCLGAKQRNLRIIYADDPAVKYRARILRYSKVEDVGLLQAPARLDVPPLEIYEGVPEVGSKVITIGHPHFLLWSAGQGIVSANRGKYGSSVLQISAPLNHGNSGGVVLDAYGRVLGIGDFFLDNPTLAFAVPSSVIIFFLNGIYR